MKVFDLYPAALTDLNIKYSQVRVTINQLPDGSFTLRAFKRDNKTVTEEVRLDGTSWSGSRNKARFFSSSTWHIDKSGGCGCGDPLRKFRIPALEESGPWQV